MRLQQCVGDICQDLLDGKADEGGSFDATVTVGNAVIDPETGATVPCDGACVLQANGIGVEGASSAPYPDPIPLEFSLEPVTEGPSEMVVTTTVPPTTQPLEYYEGSQPTVAPEDPDMTTQLAPEPLLPPGVGPGGDKYTAEGEAVAVPD